MSINEQIAEHYEELRALAHRLLGRGGGTLRTTALVHEVFLKLRAGTSADAFTQAHLMNLAARTMRQVLVDAARKRASEKHGGDWERISLSMPRAEADAGQEPALDVLAIEQSLVRLEAESPMLAQVVHLHFYGGLSFPEMSALLGVNERTLFRYWRTARAQIHADLSGAG